MNLRPHALQTKQTVVIVDGAPRWKLVRQHTPGTAGAVQIENAIDNFLHAHLSRSTAGPCWGNQGFYELPLLIRQIAWIWRPFHIILYRQKTVFQPLFTHALRDKHLGDPFVWCGHHKCRKAVGNALIHLINKRAICRLKKFVVNKN